VKSIFPGRKQVFRGEQGPADDVLSRREATEEGRPLLEPVWRDGDRLREDDEVATVRDRVRVGLDTLPDAWRRPPYVDDAPLPTLGRSLDALTTEVRRAVVDDE